MKINLAFVLILVCSPLMAISEERYQTLCANPAKLSQHGQLICRKHAKNLPSQPTTKTQPRENKARRPIADRSLSSRERRAQLNFKPYTPGAYSQNTEVNDEH